MACICVGEVSSDLRGRVQSRVSQIVDKREEAVGWTAHPVMNSSPSEENSFMRPSTGGKEEP